MCISNEYASIVYLKRVRVYCVYESLPIHLTRARVCYVPDTSSTHTHTHTLTHTVQTTGLRSQQSLEQHLQSLLIENNNLRSTIRSLVKEKEAWVRRHEEAQSHIASYRMFAQDLEMQLQAHGQRSQLHHNGDANGNGFGGSIEGYGGSMDAQMRSLSQQHDDGRSGADHGNYGHGGANDASYGHGGGNGSNGNNNDGFGMFNEHPEHQRQENNGAKDDERDGRNAVDSQSSSSNHKNMHHGSGEHQHNMHHDLDHDSHSDGMQMQMQSQHDMRGGSNGHKSMDDWHHNVPHGIFSLSAPPISDVDEGDGSSLDFGFSSTSLLAPGGRFTN